MNVLSPLVQNANIALHELWKGTGRVGRADGTHAYFGYLYDEKPHRALASFIQTSKGLRRGLKTAV